MNTLHQPILKTKAEPFSPTTNPLSAKMPNQKNSEILPASSVDDQGVQRKSSYGDKNDIDPNWKQSVDWIQRVKDQLALLKNTYRNVTITISTLDDPKELKQYAASLGIGNHLVISEDFLKKMASDEESFEKGNQLLNQMLQSLSNPRDPSAGTGIYVGETHASYWSTPPKGESDLCADNNEVACVIDMMKRIQRQTEESRKKSHISYNKALLNSTGTILTQIAGAATPMAVKSAMSTAEQAIYTLKLVVSLGSEQDKTRARYALAGLEKAISSGQEKIKNLNEESEIHRRQIKAEKEFQERKAEQIKAHLNRRQAARHSREYAQVINGRINDYYDEWLLRQNHYGQEEGFLDSTFLPGMTGVIDGTSGFTTSEATIAPSDVTILSSVEISI